MPHLAPSVPPLNHPSIITQPKPPKTQNTKQTKNQTTPQKTKITSDVRFASLPLCAESQRALSEGLRYEFCTKVQAMSLPACLSGTDVVCKAKTGSGKTIAFLLPAIESIKANPSRPRNSVACLVISPTRELAAQIAAEAAKLVQFHRPALSVQCVVGGTNMKSEASKMAAHAPDILVATPGRLIDHLKNGGLAPALQAAGGLQTLVFDEADQLLDMGFR